MTAITGKPAKIYTAYFSPTGGTKKAALALTSALADTDGFTEIDLSLPQCQVMNSRTGKKIAPLQGGEGLSCCYLVVTWISPTKL